MKDVALIFEHQLQNLIGQGFRGERFLLAVSGGLDSMVLLEAARQTFPLNSLVVAHFHHGLRGDEADRDAQLVEATCRRSGISFCSEARRGPASENQLRNERRAFLLKVAEREACAYILTAHHLNDQLETFLMRILRGSGLDGLRSIPLRNGRFLRPLLSLSRPQLGAWAKKHAVAFREDLTNQSPEFFRNLIRHTVVPPLLTASRSYGGEDRFLVRLEEMLSELDWAGAELEAQLLRKLRPVETKFWIRIAADSFHALESRWQARAVRWVYRSLQVDAPTRIEMRQVLAALRRGKRHQAPGGIECLPSCGELYFQSAGQRTRLETPPAIVARGKIVRVEALGLKLRRDAQWIKDWEIRFWKPGDHIQGRKLKETFLTHRIPRPERRLLPVLARPDSAEVGWYFPQENKGISIESVSFPFSFRER